jgi:L-seryl-tRNA(Ser) seleniumtransferase
MGSGSLPTQNLATTLVAIAPRQTTAVSLAKQLRLGETAVFTRIKDDRVLIDPRTLQDGDDAAIVKALTNALGGSE